MKHDLEQIFIDQCELIRKELQQKVGGAVVTTSIDSSNICLDDLCTQNQVTDTLRILVSQLANAIVRQSNRTVKSVVWRRGDVNYIGHFHVELEP